MSIQLSEGGEIRLDRETGGEKGLGQRAVMRLQPLNSPAGQEKVTDSFIPKIAKKSQPKAGVRGSTEHKNMSILLIYFPNICYINGATYIITYIIKKCRFCSCNTLIQCLY